MADKFGAETFFSNIGLPLKTNKMRREERFEDAEPFDDRDHRDEDGWPQDTTNVIRPSFWYSHWQKEKEEQNLVALMLKLDLKQIRILT